VREYLGEVLSYFWAERAEAFAAGEVPPLGELPPIARCRCRQCAATGSATTAAMPSAHC
jgi:hypothetical protein